MESAELKKEKRVRHSYPRREIYHRFVHDDSFVYHNGSYSVWGRDNWLFAGYCYSPKIINSKTKDELYEDWKYRNSSLIAVIDRDKKRILITNKYKEHPFDLQRAIPDNWEIFWTDEDIPSLDIFDKEEKLYKLAIKYLIEKYVEYYLTQFYRLFHVKSNIVHYDLESIYSDNNYYYKEITQFIKKYKLNKYDWSKVSLNEHFKVSYNYREWRNKDEIAIPSIRKICRNKLFTAKETTYIEQCYFYTKYCYGNGIPFNDVVKYWNKQVVLEEAINYLRKHRNYCQFKEIVVSQYWNDYVKVAVEAERAFHKRQEQEYIAESDENERKAKEEYNRLVSSEISVNDWRENRTTRRIAVKYRKYIPYRKGYTEAKWVEASIDSFNRKLFNNVQLRLSRDGKNRIETSKGAIVPYDDAKELWHKFIIWINSNRVATNPFFNFDDKNIKVGLYNLRFIRYCTKHTDNGKTIYNENGKSTLDWLIQIGCHSIWLTDVLDFINYYKLEKDFQTQYVLNPRVKPNINNNK